MGYNDLANFYKTEVMLKLYHNYSLDEQAMMIPYERDIHIKGILEKLKKLKESQENGGI